MRIFTFGASAANNFGGPSILYGVARAWREQFPDCDIVHYDGNTTSIHAVEAGDIPVRFITAECRPRRWVLACITQHLLRRYGLFKPDSVVVAAILDCDIVVDLWGIAFCDSLGSRPRGRSSVFPASVRWIRHYPFAYLAHLVGKPVVKYTSSFGPIVSRETRAAARWYLGDIVDFVLCRESQSREILCGIGIDAKKMDVVPDTGLLMSASPWDWRSQHLTSARRPLLGISVSFQLERHWTSSGRYVDFLAEVIRRFVAAYGCDVVLIPNELNKSGRDDCDVAMEIDRIVARPDRCIVLETRSLSAPQVKHVIASCDVMIASRYHSVVAALSSGVPVFVIGWHHKYDELMGLFGLDRYGVGCDGVRLGDVIEQMQSFWLTRASLAGTVRKRLPAVLQRTIAAARCLDYSSKSVPERTRVP